MEAAGVERTCSPVLSDPGAEYCMHLRYDLDMLEPMIAVPHSPDNVFPVTQAGSEKLTAAWLGSCVGGRLEDLRAVAEILAGRKVRIPTTVVPATQEVYQAGIEEGCLGELVKAGCTVQAPGCGACAGLHSGILGPGDTVISTGPRNFAGRMGSRQAQIYLGSPYVLAASAIAGRITDPRELL